MATPIDLGGLGLPPSEIGKFMSMYGVLNGIVQLFVFPRLQERWGSKNVFIAALSCTAPMIACFPLANYRARISGVDSIVRAMVVSQIVLSVMMSMAFGTLSSILVLQTFSDLCSQVPYSYTSPRRLRTERLLGRQMDSLR